MAEIDIGKLWQQSCDEATSTHQPQDIFAALVLEEAAKLAEAYEWWEEGGDPDEQHKEIASKLRTIAEGLKP